MSMASLFSLLNVARLLINSTQAQSLGGEIFDILQKVLPGNIKEMCGFIGAIKLQWLMWSKQAHLCKLLTDQSGKKHFVGLLKWTKHSESWKHFWLQMPLRHTPTIKYFSVFSHMLKNTNWVMQSFNKDNLLCIGFKKRLKPNIGSNCLHYHGP